MIAEAMARVRSLSPALFCWEDAARNAETFGIFFLPGKLRPTGRMEKRL